MRDKLHCNFLNFWAKLCEVLRQESSVEFPALGPGICAPKWPCTTILSIKIMVYPTRVAAVQLWRQPFKLKNARDKRLTH